MYIILKLGYVKHSVNFLFFKVVCFFCLTLKMSEITRPNRLFFFGELYKCLWVVLDYFLDLRYPPLEATGEASILKT